MNLKTGDIVYVNLGEPKLENKGHEESNKRPCLVLRFIKTFELSTIVPITSKKPPIPYFTIVPLKKGTGNLKKDSFALCHQLRTISSKRVISKFGNLDNLELNKIKSVVADLLEI